MIDDQIGSPSMDVRSSDYHVAQGGKLFDPQSRNQSNLLNYSSVPSHNVSGYPTAQRPSQNLGVQNDDAEMYLFDQE